MERGEEEGKKAKARAGDEAREGGGRVGEGEYVVEENEGIRRKVNGKEGKWT